MYNMTNKRSPELSEESKDKIVKDLDFAEEIFKRGLIEGSRHSQPSPETITRLTNIELTLDTIVKNFSEHSKKSEDRAEQIVLEFQKGVLEFQKGMEEFREGMKDVKTITELLSNASFMKKFFIGIGGLVTFIGGVYLMIKQILNAQN